MAAAGRAHLRRRQRRSDPPQPHREVDQPTCRRRRSPRPRSAVPMGCSSGSLTGQSGIGPSRSTRLFSGGVRCPRKTHREHPVLTPAQVERIATAMKRDDDKTIVRLLAYGGLRIGEALALRRGSLDPVGKTLHHSGEHRRGARQARRRSDQDLRRAHHHPADVAERRAGTAIGRPRSFASILSGLVASAVRQGGSVMAFGDLYLADVRAHRERQVQGSGLYPVFPLWDRDTTALSQDMVRSGLRATVGCSTRSSPTPCRCQFPATSASRRSTSSGGKSAKLPRLSRPTACSQLRWSASTRSRRPPPRVPEWSVPGSPRPRPAGPAIRRSARRRHGDADSAWLSISDPIGTTRGRGRRPRFPPGPQHLPSGTDDVKWVLGVNRISRNRRSR